MIRYRRTVYRMPNGTFRVVERPEEANSHFGVGLRQYILQQGHDELHAEKDDLLPTARQISPDLLLAMTPRLAVSERRPFARTSAGDLFASFATTDRKTWLNFLRRCASRKSTSTAARNLKRPWCGSGQARSCRRKILQVDDGVRQGQDAWYDHLALISDDAPQFKLCGFLHGLCWVHGERKIDRLIPLVPKHVAAKQRAHGEFWEIYADLKAYSKWPSENGRSAIEQRFDRLCTTKTGYQDLNEAFGSLQAKKDSSLAVLEHPGLPLHNNHSENAIREYARLQRINGGTRSDIGRRCRNTFMSLKKTCRKLGVSFSAFLTDRLSGKFQIPKLSDLMRQAATPPAEAVTPDTG